MNMQKRIEKLEGVLLNADLDPQLDIELTEWFKSHPDYQPCAQPENNHNIVIPEHLGRAFQCRVDYVLKKKNFKPNLCSLVEAWESIYP